VLAERFAAISDVHGNLAALDAVLADVATRDVRLTVNLGDLLSGPLQPAETADRLMSLDLPTIQGNHERQILETPREKLGASDSYAISKLSGQHFDWLRSLPTTLTLDSEVLLCHGTPSSDLEYFVETVSTDGARPATVAEVANRIDPTPGSLILCGHTHVPRIVKLADGRTVVNPGSVGLRAFADDLPFPHRLQVGSPHARYAILEKTKDRWHAEFVRVVYDWELAARQAENRKRLDWAHALRTGTVP
jgi:predicted phosphodiesterase